MKARRQANLFSTISFGVSATIGSGWLFASYKTAQVVGPAAIFSWILAAIFSLLLALLLAEVACMYYKETGLLARLLTISHNPDYGFVVSASNWFTLIIVIPTEAEATIQYLSTAFPVFKDRVFVNDHFTATGIFGTCVLIGVYCVLNYWGMRLLAKVNNIITIIKFIVPVSTAIIFFAAAFHPANFYAYHNTIAPYGYAKVFSAIVTCGIFYSFYGFSFITLFTKELKNPRRNIPLALGGSIAICLLIYLLLQISFLGAFNPVSIATVGWHSLDFTSPLAQLAILLGINYWAIVMYIDAAISPSGAGVVYVGSVTRTFTGMAEDGQMPQIFAKEHALHGVSRLSIIVTLIICMSLTIFFDNWSKIMITVSVFILLSCLAIPLAFVRLRMDKPELVRTFRMPFGLTGSYIAYIFISYMLVQCGTSALCLSLILHIILFLIYSTTYYRQLSSVLRAIASAWSIFIYMALILYFGYLQDSGDLIQWWTLTTFLVLITLNYVFLIRQKSYNSIPQLHPQLSK